MRWILAILLAAAPAAAQNGLRQQVRAIADQAQGKVSTACWLEGAPLNCDLNPHGHPPMQSVFKLPLGIAVLHQVEQGKLKLDQPVRFQPSDRILPHAYSPLQDKYPQAGVDVPLSELLRLTVSLSDNVAADILLRLAGGPAVVNSYIASLGIRGFHLVDNENALHHQKDLQYRNWFEPAGTKIAHKTGSSDVDNGLAHATNDIGLITLPDGRKLAVAVFVTDSRADEATRIRVIAEIGKAAYDAAAAQHRAR